MALFQRFRSRKEVELIPVDLSLVGVDMHSHFIPGIDDGAQNMEESMILLQEMSDLGYHKVITTPHVFTDLYPNTAEKILAGLSAVRDEVKRREIPIEVDAAAEYYLDENFENLIEEKKLLTFGKNYVLFELSFIENPPNLARAVFNMILQGYKPVLAHPERYEYWNENFSRYEDLADKDVYLQLNINSLTGHYGNSVKSTAEKLIDAGLVSFLGSDCHHPGHIQMTQSVRNHPRLKRLVESGKLLNTTL